MISPESGSKRPKTKKTHCTKRPDPKMPGPKRPNIYILILHVCVIDGCYDVIFNCDNSHRSFIVVVIILQLPRYTPNVNQIEPFPNDRF